MALFERCKNEKDPTAPNGCLGIADSRYTMRFDDIGEEPLYWCTFCGIQAEAMNKALLKAFKARPELAGELRKAIDEVTRKNK